MLDVQSGACCARLYKELEARQAPPSARALFAEHRKRPTVSRPVSADAAALSHSLAAFKSAARPLRLAELVKFGVKLRTANLLVEAGLVVRVVGRGRRPTVYASADLSADGTPPSDGAGKERVTRFNHKSGAANALAAHARGAARPLWRRELIAAGFSVADIGLAAACGKVERLRHGLYAHPDCASVQPPPRRAEPPCRTGSRTEQVIALAAASNGPLGLAELRAAGIPAQLPYYLARRGRLRRIGRGLFTVVIAT